MSGLPTCPECAQGKHPNCARFALDEEDDAIVPCQCPECGAPA